MNVMMRALQPHGDERGQLIAVEKQENTSFDVKRIYYIYDTAQDVRRGFHAHRELEQILICVHGSCVIHVDDGFETREYLLDRPDEGLYIGPITWREMYDFSPGAVLLVLASEHYDESDYIRNYDEFLRVVGKD